MAPYSAQRLAKPASDAERQAAKEFKDMPVELRCRFSPEESPNKLKWNSQIGLQWCFSGFGYEETATQHLRCDNALQQFVPFPQTWRTAIKVAATVDMERRKAIAETSRLIKILSASVCS